MRRLNVITSLIKHICYFSAPPNQILPPSNQAPTPSRPRSIPVQSKPEPSKGHARKSKSGSAFRRSRPPMALPRNQERYMLLPRAAPAPSTAADAEAASYVLLPPSTLPDCANPSESASDTVPPTTSEYCAPSSIPGQEAHTQLKSPSAPTDTSTLPSVSTRHTLSPAEPETLAATEACPPPVKPCTMPAARRLHRLRWLLLERNPSIEYKHIPVL